MLISKGFFGILIKKKYYGSKEDYIDGRTHQTDTEHQFSCF